MPTDPTPVRRTWFVTGGSSGIGLSLTRAAAGRGDRVVAVARDVGPLAALVDEHGGRVLALPVDVRRPAELEGAVARAVEAFGRIDVVANNAGYACSAPSRRCPTSRRAASSTRTCSGC